MYKTIIMAIIVAFIFCNCDWLKKGNDETELKTQVSANTLDIQAIKKELPNKADKSELKTLSDAVSKCDSKILKTEDKISVLESIKNAKSNPGIFTKAKKIKKICAKPVKSVKKPININDIVAGYGENDSDPSSQADIDEISQPKVIIPEKKEAVTENKTQNQDCSPLNLIDFMKKQEALVNNSLEALRSKQAAAEKTVNQQSTSLEKLVSQVKTQQITIDEHRKTLESHDKELKQLQDKSLTTETRLRVLENDMKAEKEMNKSNFDSIEYLKKLNSESEKAAEEESEEKETEETEA